MKKKQMKKEKGITLISLIITIIIMLILVGVTVNVALNGGLFSTAKKAAKDTQYEADYETLQAGIIGTLNKDFMIPNEEALKKNLPTNWSVVKEGNIYIVTSTNGNEYKVKENGEILDESTQTIQGWWEFQENEESELSEHIQNDMLYGIAQSERYYVCRAKGIYEGSDFDYVMIYDKTCMYIILLSDGVVDMYNTQLNSSYEKRKMVQE